MGLGGELVKSKTRGRSRSHVPIPNRGMQPLLPAILGPLNPSRSDQLPDEKHTSSRADFEVRLLPGFGEAKSLIEPWRFEVIEK